MDLVYIVALLIIVILYVSWKKKNKTIDSVSKPIHAEVDNEKVSKNRFLYPSDGLGKMEQDVVYESKTYKTRKTYNIETENFDIVEQNDSRDPKNS